MMSRPPIAQKIPFLAFSASSCRPKDVAYLSAFDTKKYTARTPTRARTPLIRSPSKYITVSALYVSTDSLVSTILFGLYSSGIPYAAIAFSARRIIDISDR